MKCRLTLVPNIGGLLVRDEPICALCGRTRGESQGMVTGGTGLFCACLVESLKLLDEAERAPLVNMTEKQ